jgi:hypothetical protein
MLSRVKAPLVVCTAMTSACSIGRTKKMRRKMAEGRRSR